MFVTSPQTGLVLVVQGHTSGQLFFSFDFYKGRAQNNMKVKNTACATKKSKQFIIDLYAQTMDSCHFYFVHGCKFARSPMFFCTNFCLLLLRLVGCKTGFTFFTDESAIDR